jgi:hypothetical protein
MAALDHTAALPRVTPRMFSSETGFVLLFVGLSLSWFFGLGTVYWPIVAFFVVLSLLSASKLTVPRRFGVWLLFLAWLPLSAVQIADAGSVAVFAQRYIGILAATAIFLYVFNASRDALPDSVIVNALALYWLILVVGGLIAVVLPTIAYHSPAEQLVPRSLVDVPYIHDGLHVKFADVQDLFGFPVGRPSIFFSATNAWAAMVGLLTPFAFGAVAQAKSLWRRRALRAAIGLSIVPVVVSLNRGLWIALSVLALYVAVRLALQLKLRSLAWLFALAGVTVALIFVTPLGSLFNERVTTTPNSNESRGQIYREAIDGIEASPVIGYGGTRPSRSDPDGPPVGTHSELAFLAFAHGIPALLLFLGWCILTLLRSGRGLSGPVFWAHLAILVFLVEAPYYLLEAHLVVFMIAAALIWRSTTRAPVTDRQASIVTP